MSLSECMFHLLFVRFVLEDLVVEVGDGLRQCSGDLKGTES